MSGHKKTLVSISEEEYKRLYDAETKFKYLQRDNSSMASAINEKSATLVKQAFNEMKNRQDQFHQYMDGISSELEMIEYQTDQSIENVQRNVIETLNIHSNEIVDDFSAILNEVVTKSETCTNQALYQHEIVLADLAKAVAAQSSSKDQIAEKAFNYYHYSVGLFEYLQNQFPVLIEGNPDLEDAYGWLVNFEENYQIGAVDSCLALAQLAHQKLSRIRVETETYISKYQTIKSILTSKVAQIELLCQNNHHVQAIDLKGNELPTKLDVDEWTGYRISKIEQRLDTIRKILNDDTYLKDYEKLEYLNKVTIPDLINRLEKAVLTCRLQAINSQIRVNIAEIILGAFTVQGYSMESNGFQSANYLSGYQADFSSPDGTQITVHIDPIKGAVGKNELIMDTTIPEGTTEREVVHRAEELAKAITYSGLRTPGFITQNKQVGPSDQDLLLTETLSLD